MAYTTYKLKYIERSRNKPKTYTSVNSVVAGDVIEIETGDFRYVSKVRKLVFGLLLILSGSLDPNERSSLSAGKQA
ncbi:MAG: hypothetical protein MJK10_01310 [Pseudomonadales bacterium]|nr:hypothetical protein [Pseudomonadales bacterium]NRA14514.1 hypothetical protein [Oceanospirillaceae bacterium]